MDESIKDVVIPSHLASLLIGVCNELLDAWPKTGDASSQDEADEYQENLAKVESIRDELAKRSNLRNDLSLP